LGSSIPIFQPRADSYWKSDARSRASWRLRLSLSLRLNLRLNLS